MKPLVSVLITAYNREQFIGEAIESVLASSFDDFELVIVDDCSDDRTVEIAKKYEEEDSRIRLYVNDTNLGQFENRNYTASLARGRYIKYVDSDDLIYPHALEVMVQSMEAFPDAALGQSRPSNDIDPYPIQVSPRDIYEEHFLKGQAWDRAPVGSIIRTDAFQEVGGFPHRPFVSDVGLWLKLGARFPAVKMVTGLAFWRAHPDQVTVHRRDDLSEDIGLRYELNMDMLKNEGCPLSENDRNRAKKRLRHRLAREIFWRFRQGRLDVARTVFKQSDFTLPEFLKALPRPR